MTLQTWKPDWRGYRKRAFRFQGLPFVPLKIFLSRLPISLRGIRMPFPTHLQKEAEDLVFCTWRIARMRFWGRPTLGC